MSIKIIINNVYSYVDTKSLPPELVQELSEELSFVHPNYWIIKSKLKWEWDGRVKLFDERSGRFPTGLLQRVLEKLEKVSSDIHLLDRRPLVERGHPLALKIKPYDFQTVAINKSLLFKRCVIESPTGSGKTVMIAGVLAQLNVPSLVVVHRLDIFWQLVERLESWLDCPIGMIGGSEKPKIEKINVGMLQSIAHALNKKIEIDEGYQVEPLLVRDLVKRINCLIVDESHHVPCKSLQVVHRFAINSFYRIGFSATALRDDPYDLLVEGALGPRVLDISASSLVKKGILAEPHFYMVMYDHGDYEHSDYDTLYEERVVKNEERNSLIADIVSVLVKKGLTVLVAVTRIDHGQNLTELIRERVTNSVRFIHGGLEKEIRKKTLKELGSKKLRVVVATTVFGEGIDVPELDSIVNTKANISRVDSIQLVGRALRATISKKRAFVVDIFDSNCKWLTKHAKRRASAYEKEFEVEVKKLSFEEFRNELLSK